MRPLSADTNPAATNNSGNAARAANSDHSRFTLLPSINSANQNSESDGNALITTSNATAEREAPLRYASIGIKKVAATEATSSVNIKKTTLRRPFSA